MMEAFGYYIAGSNPAPSTNAEGRAEAIPVSRQKHLLRSPTRCKQPGRKPVRCTGQNGIEIDLKADGVERDGIETRKYNQRRQGKFRILTTYEIGQRR